MHIVVLSMPMQGHLNSCLAVARLLIPQGFTFTFVLTEDLAVKLNVPLASMAEGDNSNAASSIQYTTIPFEYSPPSAVPVAGGSSAAFDLMSTLRMVDSLRPGFEALLHKLISSPRGVSFIIADTFLPWSFRVASAFNIPAFGFFATNAHTLTALLHIQILLSKGIIPAKDPECMFDCVPGLPRMRVGDLPEPIGAYPSLMVGRSKDMQTAAGIIINTVYELEKEPLEAISREIPIYSIGPMVLMQKECDKSEGRETLDLWTEERECLNWLDTKPTSCVLFIAFGSLASMSDDQVKELAEGLEASGHAFLWVIRSNAVEKPLSTLLPEGFTERTKDRGLIISWAPQLEVLSHPAVGGFFSHCGWNSITENLAVGGVPMICWPQLAEQRLNKLLLVNKWKVGLELQEEDGMVKKAEVEKVVTQLMQGEVGRDLRIRVLELKEMISLCVQEGGSSQIHLRALGQDIKKLALAP